MNPAGSTTSSQQATGIAMERLNGGLTALLLLISAACEPGPDLEALRTEIGQLHEDFIQAHLDKDASFLARSLSPDYLAVSDGTVQHRTREEMEALLTTYLSETEFSHYRDTSDPIIGLSDDGSMAWVIAQVRVAGAQGETADDRREFDTQWAWLSIFRRSGQEWIRVTDVSTSRPFGAGVQ